MKKNKAEKMIALILSLMLSIIICCQIIIDKNNLQLKFISNTNILSFILMILVILGILYFLLVNIFIKVPKFTSKDKEVVFHIIYSIYYNMVYLFYYFLSWWGNV